MQSAYQPGELEQNIYSLWESKGYFKPTGNGKPYCIMLPPPNVTGSLHMGHGFQHTLMDLLIRYHRMSGNNTLWQPGTDHAGIATQMVVERNLAEKNQTRLGLGRESFTKAVWEWKEKSGNRIVHQMQRMGTSADWSRLKFTMDDDLSYAVRKTFVDLYREGLIYRGKRLVNWDPVLLTAISDLEVETQEEQGSLWHIRYPLSQGQGELVVATTRPETLLGDTAVAVHPDDEHYQAYIGKTVRLPLVNRDIPVIADDTVLKEFGTGCVKITPAHDFNDYAMGKRHQLPMINILTPDAHLNENAPTQYRGMDRFDARKKIVEDLEREGYLVKVEPYRIKIPRGDRTRTVIEPFLTDQWFVKTAPLAEPAIKAVEEGKIRFIPDEWAKTYFQWMRNIEDWCISRQLWWGHRIPAWYDEAGNVYVGVDEQEVRERNHLSPSITLKQEEDVLDTWFSAALWPFSTLGWPNQTSELSLYYPTDVLVTGFDIIFFWVARMVMFALKFTGKIPFKVVYMTGLIRDSEGQKMSKSKGNILDPLDLIDGIDLESLLAKRTMGLMQPGMAEKIKTKTKKEFPKGIPAYGVDAVRFTFCSLAGTSRDINFSLERLEGNRNFCTKLWNASRYGFQKIEQNGGKVHLLDIEKGNSKLHVIDQWILSRTQKMVRDTHEHIKNYRFDLLAQTIYEFIWHEYCDWYLELTKPILSDPTVSAEQKQQTLSVLCTVLKTILQALHPVMPFITESLWQELKKHVVESLPESVMVSAYPTVISAFINDEAEKEIEWIQKMILAIRNIRGELNISPQKPILVLLKQGTVKDQNLLKKHTLFLKNLARLTALQVMSPNDPIPPSMSAFIDTLELYIPMQGLVDKDAELNRLTKELGKVESDMTKTTNKLQNAAFIEKAPEELVNKEKAHLEELTLLQKKLLKQKAAVQVL